MTTTAPARLATVRAIIADVLEIEEDEITSSSLFIEDHGADSLGAIEILSRVERELDVIIPQDDLIKMVNLQAVIEVLDAGEVQRS